MIITVVLHCESKKIIHDKLFIHNFIKRWLIFSIFSLFDVISTSLTINHSFSFSL